MCNAQLHYTTFNHLARVFTLKGAGLNTPDEFVEAVVRLTAATDVADELLQRATNRGTYPPWSKGMAARKDWRDAHGWPLQHIRRYRNRLLHGIAVPYEERRQIPRIDKHGNLLPDEHVLRLPKIGQEAEWLDWRNLESLNALVLHRDFAAAGQIVNEAWTEVLTYLEEQWQAHLVGLGPSLIRESEDEAGPGDEPNTTGTSGASPNPARLRQ